MSQPSENNADQTNEQPPPTEPPVGSWAAVARLMAQSEDPNDPSGVDWDQWKDEMKESDL